MEVVEDSMQELLDSQKDILKSLDLIIEVLSNYNSDLKKIHCTLFDDESN